MIDGSEEHKLLFCQSFIDTHRVYDPATLPWPDLDQTSVDRLRSIPFWPVALAAEQNAGRMVSRFAETIVDPHIREAMAVQGVEETRHGRLLEVMLERYAITLDPAEPHKTEVSERAFLDFGYEECIDAFFGFGIFGLGRREKLFPDELLDVFEYVLAEEARHVVFFVNWIAYERARRGRGWLAARAAATGLGYARAIRRLISTFAPGEKTGVGFAADGAGEMIAGLTWRAFLQSCTDENERRMRAFDPRLARPRLLSRIASTALALPSRTRLKPAAAQAS